MNTKLVALFFLLQQKLKTKEEAQEELSHYTTEYLFDVMVYGDKNPSFKPELVFEVIEQRGDYTGEQLIHFLRRVKYTPYNCRFKVSVCMKLLKRDDYVSQKLLSLFCNRDNNGNKMDNHLSMFFLKENEPLVVLKLASYSFAELVEIIETGRYLETLTRIAKKLAEEKLHELSTTDLLLLENKGGRVRVDAELANRVDELKKIVSM